MVPILALPPGLKRCLQLAQANPANPLSEPPGATNSGFPILISQGAHHLAWQARWHNVPRRTQAYPSSPRPTRWETCPSCQRRIRRLKAGCRHSGPPRHGPRLYTLLYSPFSPTCANEPAARPAGLTPRLLSTSSKSAHATREPGLPTSPR